MKKNPEKIVEVTSGEGWGLALFAYERLDLSRSWINPEALKKLKFDVVPDGCIEVRDEREET